MPYVRIKLTESDMKLVRRLARYEKMGEAATLYHLLSMGLDTVRSHERAGWHYGPAPSLPEIPKPRPRFANKDERDAWVLHGIKPGDEGNATARA